MVRDCYIGPVHHDMVVGMSRAIRWKVRMRPQRGTTEVCAPNTYVKMHLSVLPTALTPSKVKGMESVSWDTEGDVAPKQYTTTAWNGGDMLALGRTDSTKADVVRDSLQRTPDERQKWELLKREFRDVLSNTELPTDRPPTGSLVYRVELVPGAAPSFVSRYRENPELEEESDRQVGELLQKGNVQESTSVFGHNRALAGKRDG